MSQRQQALAYFMEQGWTAAQAAGIVANLEAESNLRPDAVGDGGQAYGIAQWHPPRQAEFSRLYGRSIQGSTLEDQLAFVHAELIGTEEQAGLALRTCLTPAAAGSCVSRLYERPADKEGEAARRSLWAEEIAAAMQPAAPIEERGIPYQPPENPMGPALFLPAILQLIPSLISALGKGEQAQKNAKAAEVVVNAFTQAVPASLNTQDAIQKAQANPALLAEAKAKVLADPAVVALMEVGSGGVGGARKAMTDLIAASPNASWKVIFNPLLIITLSVLPLVYIVVWELVKHMAKVSPDVIAQTIGTVIGLVLGSACGFWFGQTYTNNSARRTTDTGAQG